MAKKIFPSTLVSLACSFFLFVFVFPSALAQGHGWESRGIGGGGALFSATMSAYDPGVIYIATDMSAVFRTSNLGLTWDTLDFRQLRGGIDSHVRFTSDPSILYAVRLADDLKTPVKSADGGQTWAPLSSDPTYGEVWFLHADPNSTQRLLITDYSNLYVSIDGGASFSSTPVYSSSDIRIAGVFWDGDNVYVGSRDGLLVSTDGGATFALSPVTGLSAGEPMVSLVGAKEGGQIRFFAVTVNGADVYGGMTGDDMWGYRGVYRLNWGETSWTRKTTGIPDCAHPFFVDMAPDSIDVAYLAGGRVYPCTGAPIVYKTTNGGDTWTEVFKTDDNQNIKTGWCGDGGDTNWWYPEYALGFAVSPIDPDRVIITDLGFAHVTDDGGTSWRQVYVNPDNENPAGIDTPKGKSYRGNGLEDTSAWWLHWPNANTLFACFSDMRGTISRDKGKSWASGFSLGLPHNTTCHVVEHPLTRALYAATSSVHDIYQSTRLEDSLLDDGEGSVIISNDNGETWNILYDFGHPVIWLAMDPNNSNTMYASVIHSSQGGIYVTNNLDAGTSASWVKLSSPPRTEGHPYNIHVLNDGTLVTTYSGRRGVSGFTESSGVFISEDSGNSWQDKSHPNMRRWTKDLVMDPHDPDQSTWCVAVFSHWGAHPNEVGGLYQTINRGDTWTRISALYRVESATYHPSDPNIQYLATETRGLWRTDNLRAGTPTFAQVHDYPFGHPVRIFFNPYDTGEIWIVSFGGGLRVLDSSSPPEGQASPIGQILLLLFSN